MKILYIHGLNSNKDSSTGRIVREYVTKKKNAEVITETFNLTDIQNSKEKAFRIILDQHINFVVASSLGAFVALALGDAIPKILINPCMQPSTVLQNIEPTISNNVIEEFKREETQTYDDIDGETREYTYAAFSTHDELFSFEKFFKQYFGNRYIKVQGGGHRLNEQQVQEVLDQFVPNMKFIKLHTPIPGFEDENFNKQHC